MERRQEMARQRRRIERNARALAPRIAEWLRRRARVELKRALGMLRADGRIKISKGKLDDLDEELIDMLSRFGIRQIDESGKALVVGYGGEWTVPPKLIDQIMRLKEIKVTRLSANIRDRVLEELRSISREANAEKPKPSVGELARRMRERFDADKEPIWALDPKRAALIARTESQQNEQTGLFEGAREVGVEAKRWLASGNPDHGDRRHDLMDGQERLLDEPFVNPTTGEQLMYPGDPKAKISETAN